MARSEYWSCPLRLPTPAAAHVAIAYRREPEGDIASPHEGSVVLGPVPDAIRCRVLRMRLSTSHRDHDPPAVAMVNMPATARPPR